MSADQLVEFFRTLGTGAKTIGGVHDNFGVGAKIAVLPWNPNGMVVISYQNGRAAMIKIGSPLARPRCGLLITGTPARSAAWNQSESE